MTTIIVTTDEKLTANFTGILIEVSDTPMFDLHYRVPGWKCVHCGWTVGTAGYPPPHECPVDGVQQQCQHQWGEDFAIPYKLERPIVGRDCTLCGKSEYRFADGCWLGGSGND